MTAIEDAQVRVAKAEDAKAKLQEEIHKKHGSISDLDSSCRHDPMGKKNGPKDLRRRYNEATKELRLAKSDLARMRNEENQQEERPSPEAKEEAAPSRLELARADGRKAGENWLFVAKDRKFDDAKKGEAVSKIEKDLRTEREKSPPNQAKVASLEAQLEVLEAWSAAPPEQKDPAPDAEKRSVMQVMEENAAKAEASRAMSVVISDEGVSIDGRAPVPREVVSAAIDVIKGRKKVQMDLEGRKAKAPLSGRIKVPPERFELETPSFIIRGNKEEVQDLVREGSRESVRQIVQQRLRIKKDAIVPDGEFDRMVERFVDEIMRGILHRLPEDD